MVRLTVSGRATAYTREGRRLTAADDLRAVSGLVSGDAFTDSLGGRAVEDALASILQPGGRLALEYRGDVGQLWVITEYLASRPLSDSELRLLIGHTVGQWADGAGTDLEIGGYLIDCYPTDLPGFDPEEPVVEQHAV